MKRSRPVTGRRALSSGVAAAVLLVAAAGCGGGEAAEDRRRGANDGVRPAGAGARGRHRGAAPRADVSVATTVLAQDGTPGAGLRVARRRRRRLGPVAPCGAGRYCGELAVDGPRPQLRVRLTRPGGRVSTVSMRLPRIPSPSARPRSCARPGRVPRAALGDRQRAARVGAAVRAAAHAVQLRRARPPELPDRRRGRGGRDRHAPLGPAASTSRWQKSSQEPTQVPATDWRRVRDASLLGTVTRDGRAVELVSFYDPTVPAGSRPRSTRDTQLPLDVRDDRRGALHDAPFRRLQRAGHDPAPDLGRLGEDGRAGDRGDALGARDHVRLDELRGDRDRDLLRRAGADLDPDRGVEPREVGLADALVAEPRSRSVRVFSLPIAPM